ncbi:MAG TPA: hypothetical protein VJ965_09205 [Anaerolineales bacterium]|nr:hypothetical protein [Anaerolineales bacterium]
MTTILIFSAAACSLQAESPSVQTPPTYTPYPTYTPFPEVEKQSYEFVLIYGPEHTGFSGIEDFDQECQWELGEDSRQADWIDLQFYIHDGYPAADLSVDLNMEQDTYAWISLASQTNFNDSDEYAMIYSPTREVFFDGLDALPDWSEAVFVLSHHPADPMVNWIPALCLMEEQINKMP